MDGKALEMVVGDLSASINEVGLQGKDILITSYKNYVIIMQLLRNYIT